MIVSLVKHARRHWDSSTWQDLGIASLSIDHGNLISHVWPGGYPAVYVDPEDELEGLCADTVREMIAAGEWPDGRSVDSYTHYEGAAVECSCGKSIQSAYGDPDVETCDECKQPIPDVDGGAQHNRHHAQSCSLYAPNQE